MPFRVLFLSLVLPTALRAAEPDFRRDVLPVLRRACFECHGSNQQRGELRLDSRQALLKSSAIVPGKPAVSELIRRVQLKVGERGVMPARGPTLSADEIDRLRAWIAAGAPWPENPNQHWAYVPPKRIPPPRIRRASAEIRNPIDAFVLDRLAQEGLEPSPPADPAVLLRRLTFDLTGLPPTIRDVDEFLNDRSPNAYERRVDRLLASPSFGERWARPWLDLARYADSHGYQRDDLRELWAFRDWVILALNGDMPFDRFTIEQLAGDLLPRPTLSQLIATGFHRCAPLNVESGTDPEDSRLTQVIDRVNTTATVWLGTTLECAQCHDHKNDPISQREYYRFLAFFNNSTKEADHSDPKIPASIQFLGPNLRSGGSATLIMEELAKPRPTAVLNRGDFHSPGELVRPGTPAIGPPFQPLSSVPNRLDLARWLVGRDHPLTARVVVNRWWAELFGQGLVTTPADFGSGGEPPSHPELLDWLAVEFMDHGWSMKHIIRTIVTSSTYRQSSRWTTELKQHDPTNRWLARGPRVRLDAEAIRDNALAISGQLLAILGGPPVRPPQPEGLWAKVSGEKIEYRMSPPNERNRRGLYVLWKRSSPYPSMAIFDATDRLTCSVKRSRSNTPAQALVLLNDPVYVEAAQMLARRVAQECQSTELSEKLRYAFRLCLAREPRPAELTALQNLYRSQVAAKSTLSPMQAVATVLLNLDETITKP